MMRKLVNHGIVTIVLLSFVCKVQAQSFDDILNANFAHYSRANNKSINGDSIYSNQLSIGKINFAGPPIPIIKDKLTFIYSAEYKWYHNNTATIVSDKKLLANNLHDIKTFLILNWRIKPKWSLNISNYAAIRNDFEGQFNLSRSFYSTEAFTVTFHPKKDNNLRLGLGVSHSRDFGRSLILPTVVVYYRNEKWLVDLLYPRLNVFYKAKPKLELGLLTNFDTGIFSINQNEYLAAKEEIYYHQIINLTISPTIGYYVTKNINLYVKMGIAPLSVQRLLDKDYKPVTGRTFFGELNYMIGGGINIRVPR